jgi:hypothetical protein
VTPSVRAHPRDQLGVADAADRATDLEVATEETRDDAGVARVTSVGSPAGISVP